MGQAVAMRLRHLVIMLVAVLGLASVSGCSEETQKKVDDAVESAKQDIKKKSGEAGARAAAEALRLGANAKSRADDKPMRSVSVLRDVAKELPSSVTVSGIDDGNGDGLDDDGRVSVAYEGKNACVELPEQGRNATVRSGSC